MSHTDWLFSVLRRRYKTAILAMALMTAGGYVAYTLQPRIYHSAFTVRVMTDELPSELKRLESILLPTTSSLDTLSNVLLSEKVLQDVLRRAGLATTKLDEGEHRRLMESLRASITVHKDPAANIIKVRVAREDPQLTFALARALLDSFMDEEVKSRRQKDEEARTASLDRGKRINLTLAKMEMARQRLQKAVTHEQETVQRTEARAALRKEFLAEIGRLEEEHARLQRKFTEGWPELRTLSRQVSLVKGYGSEGAAPAPPAPDAAAAASPDEIEALEASLEAWKKKGTQLKETEIQIRQALANMDQALLDAWRAEPEYLDLAAIDREMAMLREALDYEARNRLRLDAGIATTVSSLRLMEAPFVPSWPSSPNPTAFFTAVALLALMAAVFVGYALEHADPTLRTVEAIQHYTQCHVLTLVPFMNGEHAKEGYPCRLAYTPAGQSTSLADPYRMLKTNIDYAVAPVTNPVILITSAFREEGKSTTTANLSFAFAEERRTLLISGNLRRPVAHLFFGSPMEGGLVDILEGRIPWQECVRQTAMPNIHLINAGRIVDNSSVLLNRPAFRTLLDQARQKYDVVLVDSPPVLLVTDAMVIAPHADAVILVYALGTTDKRDLLRAVEFLGRIKAKFIGIAANVKEQAQSPPGRHHYYYYHSKT